MLRSVESMSTRELIFRTIGMATGMGSDTMIIPLWML